MRSEGRQCGTRTCPCHGADVQHGVVLEDAAVLQQPHLTQVLAAVVHLHAPQLDGAVPAGDVPLPLHPVPVTAHGDAAVAVVIKHHLLLPGHRASGERSPGDRALPCIHPLLHSRGCSLSLSPRAAQERVSHPHPPGKPRDTAPSARVPQQHAAGELSSRGSRGQAASPKPPESSRAASLPLPCRLPPASPLVLTHLLRARSRHMQPVHLHHRPALVCRVSEEALQQDRVPSAGSKLRLCEHPASRAAASLCQAQGQQDEAGEDSQVQPACPHRRLLSRQTRGERHRAARSTAGSLFLRPKPLPDPCFWRAWDVGQHILPATRHRGLLRSLDKPHGREVGKAPQNSSLNPSPLRAGAEGCSSCMAAPVSHWLGEPVPLSSTRGQGQLNPFT